jgi:hypothetical protein
MLFNFILNQSKEQKIAHHIHLVFYFYQKQI